MKTTFARKMVATLAGMASLVAGNAFASIIAYDNSVSGPIANPLFPLPNNPLQDWNGSLGLDFNVNKPIEITALGAFDNGVVGNLDGVNGGGVTVQIYTVAGAPVGPSVYFTQALPGTQINADAFKSISALLLPVGSYSVVAFNDDNYNQGFINTTFNPTSVMNDGGGLISFVGGGRYSGGFGFPTTPDTGPANRYDAGTFAFTAVPEPTTLISGALLLLPFGASTLRILRRGRVA